MFVIFLCVCFLEFFDIGNWFFSYVYELLFVLDINDVFCFLVGGEDSECVKET